MFNSYQNIEIIKSVQLDFGTIELRSDDILTYVPLPHLTTLNLSQLKIMNKVLVDLCEGKPKPFLSDNRNVKSFGFAEREYVGKTFHHFASCSAILEDAVVVRFITHSIILMFKPSIPLKLFKKKEDAIKWLRTYPN
jgi:hypothetical protein